MCASHAFIKFEKTFQIPISRNGWEKVNNVLEKQKERINNKRHLPRTDTHVQSLTCRPTFGP